MGDTYERTSKIRDIINAPRMRHLLMRDLGRWLRLCSSLDVVEDCELAIEAYPSAMADTDSGRRYLGLYGLLQAMFLQQDALKHLGEVLGTPFRPHDDPVLLRIRELRNAGVGHPTRRDRGKGLAPTHHFISRVSIIPEGFTLLSTSADGAGEHEDVRIGEVISGQAERVNAVLDTCLAKVESDEAEHRAAHASETLAFLFPDTLGYALEKVSEGVDWPERRCTGRWGLETVRAALHSFEEALVRRGCDLATYAGVEGWFRELKHPLDGLSAFYGVSESTSHEAVSGETAIVFARYVHMRLPELRQMAEEIDADYSEDAVLEEQGDGMAATDTNEALTCGDLPGGPLAERPSDARTASPSGNPA